MYKSNANSLRTDLKFLLDQYLKKNCFEWPFKSKFLAFSCHDKVTANSSDFLFLAKWTVECFKYCGLFQGEGNKKIRFTVRCIITKKR